jgi:hypothetical protein
MHLYGYKPEAKFFGKSDYYFGLELETKVSMFTEKAAETIVLSLNGLVYCKEDGTLGDSGIEVVTHPMTLEFLEEAIPTLSRVLEDAGCRVDDNCGMHVHVSRSAFQDVGHIYRVICLWQMISEKERLEVAGRPANNYCYFVDLQKLLGELLIAEAVKTGVVDFSERSFYFDHYNAVNVQNEHTVEFRMFAGTVDASVIVDRVKFVQKLIDFARPVRSINYQLQLWEEARKLEKLRASLLCKRSLEIKCYEHPHVGFGLRKYINDGGNEIILSLNGGSFFQAVLSCDFKEVDRRDFDSLGDAIISLGWDLCGVTAERLQCMKKGDVLNFGEVVEEQQPVGGASSLVA